MTKIIVMTDSEKYKETIISEKLKNYQDLFSWQILHKAVIVIEPDYFNYLSR
jgi:hypothetical protein